MIKLASPDIREEDIRRAAEVLQSGNLIQGINVATFEDELVRFSGIKHCAVVSSGTAALHLALKALGISTGDTVIVPAFTFPATANSATNIGADVLFCDVDPTTYVMTPELIERTIEENYSNNIKALIVVHEFGYPADMKSIKAIAKRHGLRLIEDAACALGTTTDGHHVGHYSDVACFSFHPRKAITTGEGGAVLGNDRELVEKIKSLRNHGISYTEKGLDFFTDGLNYRMTDFQAALAIGQLARFRDELGKRHELAEVYRRNLSGVANISLPAAKEGQSWQSFMIVLSEGIDRKIIVDMLARKGVEANLGAQALHELSFFRHRYGFGTDDFPVAANLYRNGLVLPLYGKLTINDIEYISETLKGLLNAL